MKIYVAEISFDMQDSARLIFKKGYSIRKTLKNDVFKGSLEGSKT